MAQLSRLGFRAALQAFSRGLDTMKDTFSQRGDACRACCHGGTDSTRQHQPSLQDPTLSNIFFYSEARAPFLMLRAVWGAIFAVSGASGEAGERTEGRVGPRKITKPYFGFGMYYY